MAPAPPVVQLLLRLLFQAPWAAADNPPPLLCPEGQWTEVAQPPEASCLGSRPEALGCCPAANWETGPGPRGKLLQASQAPRFCQLWPCTQGLFPAMQAAAGPGGLLVQRPSPMAWLTKAGNAHVLAAGQDPQSPHPSISSGPGDAELGSGADRTLCATGAEKLMGAWQRLLLQAVPRGQ